MSISDSKSCIYIYIVMAYDQYYFKINLIKVVLEGLILQSNRNPLMPKIIMKITIYMTCKLLSKKKNETCVCFVSPKDTCYKM